MKKIILETERLILRPISVKDAEDYFEFAKLDSVGPNAGWKPHKSITKTKSIIRNILNLKPCYEMPNMVLVLKETGKMIGTVELYNFTYIGGLELNQAELGFAINPLYENNGYMTEAVTKILEYGFCELELKSIYAHVFVSNEKSIKLMNRLNIPLIGKHEHAYLRYDGEVFDYYLFILSSDEYFKGKNNYEK